MTDLPFRFSPQQYARGGGVLYLVIIAIGLWDEAFVRQRLIVSGDAQATAAHLRTMASLWRLGLAAELLLLLCAVLTTWIFYLLWRTVNRDLALLAVFFNLVSMAVEAVIQLLLLPALLPLDQAMYRKAFTAEQLATLAYLPLPLYDYGFGISLAFFGGYCLVMGYLLVRSGYLPSILGRLLQIAGLCYLINSFALLGAPDFQARLFPAILVLPFLGELSLALWLSCKGIEVSVREVGTSGKKGLGL